jgi:hypothetical protein
LGFYLGVNALGPATHHVVTASIGANRETRWNRQLQNAGHLGKIGTLAPEQIFHLHWWAAMFLIK